MYVYVPIIHRGSRVDSVRSTDLGIEGARKAEPTSGSAARRMERRATIVLCEVFVCAVGGLGLSGTSWNTQHTTSDDRKIESLSKPVNRRATAALLALRPSRKATI